MKSRKTNILIIGSENSSYLDLATRIQNYLAAAHSQTKKTAPYKITTLAETEIYHQLSENEVSAYKQADCVLICANLLNTPHVAKTNLVIAASNTQRNLSSSQNTNNAPIVIIGEAPALVSNCRERVSALREIIQGLNKVKLGFIINADNASFNTRIKKILSTADASKIEPFDVLLTNSIGEIHREISSNIDSDNHINPNTEETLKDQHSVQALLQSSSASFQPAATITHYSLEHFQGKYISKEDLFTCIKTYKENRRDSISSFNFSEEEQLTRHSFRTDSMKKLFDLYESAATESLIPGEEILRCITAKKRSSITGYLAQQDLTQQTPTGTEHVIIEIFKSMQPGANQTNSI